MDKVPGSILAEILRKRIESLGYPSLRKFHADRKDLALSYELLRQVVYIGRIPRSETLMRILQAMRFPPAQAGKILEIAYRGLYRQDQKPLFSPSPPGDEQPPAPSPAGGDKAPGKQAASGEPQHLSQDLDEEAPAEIAGRLARCLPKLPLKGNEDFWETMRHMADLADRKAAELARRRADQPLLFETEPEAIYHFLVRSGRVVPYMSKGEPLPLAFAEGIDYGDRFRGALLGAAIGEILGRPAQGLSPRDVAELYGRIDGSRVPRAVAFATEVPAMLHLARVLVSRGRIDPKELAARYAGSPGASGSGGPEFARNVVERGYPWFEAGTGAPDSAPAVRIAPLALCRAADFRRLKLEAGIEAAVTHPGAVAVAGSICQAAAVARILHTPPGSLDVLGFGRILATAVAGIEPDRASRTRAGRPASSLWRRIGTDLPALLLRRAAPDEIAEALGNGPAAIEGIPFGWACFLRAPADFEAVVLSAANLGRDAQGTASIAGALCGGYLGASGIPDSLCAAVPWRRELEGAADALLAQARREAPP